MLLHPEIPHSASDLRMAEQKLDRTQVTCAAIDQGCFGPPQ
jgi:hypothetical protein